MAERPDILMSKLMCLFFKKKLSLQCLKISTGIFKKFSMKNERTVWQKRKKIVILRQAIRFLFLPIPGHPWNARYYDPYEIESKISDVNDVASTADRGKQKKGCHIIMFKEYHKKCE